MIALTQYRGKKVGVFGLGKAGEAAVASFLAGGAEVYVWDDRFDTTPPSGESNAHRQHFSSWPWKELAVLCLSPGVPLTHPTPHAVVTAAKQHNCSILGDVELLYTSCPDATYIGITGTNGKSTTTTLIAHILQTAGIKMQVGGNLGTPALALEPLGKDGVYVLEMSSYQLDLLHQTRFNIALLLNITPDHLDRHGDMDGYIKAKMHIFERQQKNDVAIVATDDEYTKRIQDSGFGIQGKIVEVSAQHPADIYVEKGILHDGAQHFDLNGIETLPGRHNWQNAVIAYAAAKAAGVAPEVIYKAMQSFAGLRHRLQTVATINGVRFINDSKATNADATSNALAPYDTIYWILGGKPKAGGIDDLVSYFPKIVHAFLIGEATDAFAATLEGKVAYTRSGTLDVAVKQAAEMAFAQKKKGAVVLLSPACASFDQFKSFEQRGDVFCELVEGLKAEVKHAV